MSLISVEPVYIALMQPAIIHFINLVSNLLLNKIIHFPTKVLERKKKKKRLLSTRRDQILVALFQKFIKIGGKISIQQYLLFL